MDWIFSGTAHLLAAAKFKHYFWGLSLLAFYGTECTLVPMVPDEVKLCNEHDLFFQYLHQCMEVCAELRFTRRIHIQYNTDTAFLYDSKNSPTARK